VWTGELAWSDAVRTGSVQIRGAGPLARSFPGWLRLGVFAGSAAAPGR